MKDLEPERRHDGSAFALMLFGLLVAAQFWFGLPGAVGTWIAIAVTTVVGVFAYAVPVVALAVSWRTFRHPERHGSAGRQVVGWAALLFGTLGVIHIARGLPPGNAPEQVRGAGGFLGFLSSSPLVELVGTWIAVPLLVIVAVIGFLVVLGIPLNELSTRVKDLVAKLKPQPRDEIEYGANHRAYDSPLLDTGEIDVDDEETVVVSDEPKPGRRRQPVEPAPAVPEIS